ncbi:MAG: Mrp/NBP35 family ATP-binding protein [Ignavibacteriaceae bacterium]|jgi:ATP-binding protein involved in chromosome partitioning
MGADEPIHTKVLRGYLKDFNMNENEKNILLKEEEKRIEETITKIKHRIAVFSGKGGVGKTTVSVNLAFCYQNEGFSTGILDADITGPNAAKMLGIKNELIILNQSIIPFEKNGVKMVSIAGLIQPGQPVIWRGPLRSKLINQFLADVAWGELDFLIADLPPGTGDEILTISQKMKPDYAVIITTPQEVSVIDAERAVNMAKKLEIPFIGIIENMSGFICPLCKNKIDLFDSGGGKKLADEYNVQFLGSIPIDIDIRILSDKGESIINKKPDSEVSNSFKSIVNKIEEHFNEIGNKQTTKKSYTEIK